MTGIRPLERRRDNACAGELCGDFDGSTDLTLQEATPEGRTKFVLTAGVVDEDAEAFFGRGFCHWLAGAIHCLTGWTLAVVDVDHGQHGWRTIHTAAITPGGTLLDIFGEHSAADMRAGRIRDGWSRVRLRHVTGADLPGDAVTDIDYLRGDPLWWTKSLFNTPKLQGLVLHFARLLLRRHGFGHWIDDGNPVPRQGFPPGSEAQPEAGR
ncbi:hypothetical protein L3Q65_00535 (plasmid) [Amycolatopsis sp. FU40]|uniref:hypothetical protein n=1 Tax=Amycolatopsis sp. FU40 TaxID=2914159 RepID=UPI001F2CC761|nr:hypothetical protein [Amycolatopsis sp. FU40]UKD50815.1 hypothetical protein L3Q65_00535 [Amycolatopsis sp. FU40]